MKTLLAKWRAWRDARYIERLLLDAVTVRAVYDEAFHTTVLQVLVRTSITEAPSRIVDLSLSTRDMRYVTAVGIDPRLILQNALDTIAPELAKLHMKDST